MEKKKYISAILLFAFSFVLTHDMITHHHHDDHDEISRVEDEGHNHSHQHDKKEQSHHDDSQEHQHRNGESIDDFSHLSHKLASTKIIISDDTNFQKKPFTNQFCITTSQAFSSLELLVRLKPPNYISTTSLQRFSSKHFLNRGPPIFTI